MTPDLVLLQSLGACVAVLEVTPPNRDRPDTIRVERAVQRDGSIMWAVRLRGNVLARDLAWEYEPIPSSRDVDFLTRCRFPTLVEAWSAALAKQ